MKSKLLTKKISFLQNKYKANPSLAGNKAEDLYNDYTENNSCISCAMCCKTLGPRITPQDIKHLAKILNFKESELTEKYLKTDEDGDKIFKTMPCPFLGADNLCVVYEARPRACREYPHITRHSFYKLLKTHKKNYDYCPAVIHVIDKLYEIS